MAGLIRRIAVLLERAPRGRPSRPSPEYRPSCDDLEARPMLSGLGTDYTLMGGQWDDSQPITFSFPSDGVSWSKGTNTLNATLNAEYGGTSWRGLVARALQTWASVTNLDFTPAADGAYGFDASGAAEGDSRFGDIRIGGSDYGTTPTIALTYGPPPNGRTGAGDVNLNLNYDFGPDGTHDLETILLHELGHSLGLNESPKLSAAMYSYYSGVRQSLSPYDIEGIQSIYGPRTPDAYQAKGQGTAPSNAIDLTPLMNANRQFTLAGVKLAKIGGVEYFSVVAPSVNGAKLNVSARATGISLLSPKITLIDPATGKVLATAGDASRYGNTVSASFGGVQAGHRYLIAVTGATDDVFAVGSYAVQGGFTGGSPILSTSPPVTVPVTPPPVTPPPVTPTPVVVTPQPIVVAPPVLTDGYEGHDSYATAVQLGTIDQTVVHNLVLNTGLNIRVFAFQNAQAGTVLVASENAKIMVTDALTRPIAMGTGLIGFVAPVAGARYFLVFLSPNGAQVPNFGFAVSTIPAPPPPIIPLEATPTPVTPTKAGQPRRTPEQRAAAREQRRQEWQRQAQERAASITRQQRQAQARTAAIARLKQARRWA